MELYKAKRIADKAPISEKVTSGIAANPSRNPVGYTCFNPLKKSSLANSIVFYSS